MSSDKEYKKKFKKDTNEHIDKEREREFQFILIQLRYHKKHTRDLKDGWHAGRQVNIQTAITMKSVITGNIVFTLKKKNARLLQ